MQRLNHRNLPPELLGIASLNFAAPEDSSARQEMVGSHLSQTLVVEGASPRRCFTGMERRFGEATFAIKVPCNAEIKEVFPKYPISEGPGGIAFNPVDTVIFEDIEKGVIDVLDLPHYHSVHHHFGFKYKRTPEAMRLTRNTAFRKGTILANSPSVDARGNYMLGTELKTAFMSIPGVLEDGMVVAESVAKKLTSSGFEKRFGNFGANRYPLNLFGTPQTFKIHPDVGETIRPDGLLMAFREYDPLLAGVEMAEDCLREVDHVFDQRVYAVPNATVIDVSAYRGTHSHGRCPESMCTQPMKYHRLQRQYYTELTRRVDQLTRHGNVTTSPRLHRLMVEGHIFTNDIGKTKPKLMFNLKPMDEWRIDITFEYKVVPSIGSKLSDVHGGKGVICAIWRDEDMPVDQWGTQAELIRDPVSVTKRMNPGCLYEQFFNAQSDAMQRRLKAMQKELGKDFLEKAWDMLLDYWTLVSPRTVDLLTSPRYKGSPKKVVEDALRDGLYHWLPTVSPVTLLQAVRNLRQHYPLTKGPVTYRAPNGERVTTERDVIVGSVYTILLEKTGDEWSGVSSTKLNHFGIPAKVNRHDKYATPARPSPVRILGESELRLMAAAVGGQAIAELVEASNSPPLHKHIVRNILATDTPTRIESVVTDENLIGRGGRNLAFLHHSFEIAGMQLERQPTYTGEPTIYPPKEGENAL